MNQRLKNRSVSIRTVYCQFKAITATVLSLTEQDDRDFIEKSLQDSEKVQVQTFIL